MSDHKAQAEALVASELAGGSFDQTRDYIALAQVHATLYLAEQQRIGNLIAYLPEASVYASLGTNGTSDRSVIDVRVRDGLGLS